MDSGKSVVRTQGEDRPPVDQGEGPRADHASLPSGGPSPAHTLILNKNRRR